MNHIPRILIIEDDKLSREMMRDVIIGINNYDVICAANAREAAEALSENPDAILLDLCLPDANGRDLLEILRNRSNVPVIVVSSLSDCADKVAAFDVGADDYITNPFDSEELSARLRRVIHRSTDEDKKFFEAGGLRIDYRTKSVSVNGITVKLTNSEYRILELISSQNGRLTDYDTLIADLWGDNDDIVNPHKLLRVNMTNIRRKLAAYSGGEAYIETDAGKGYRMKSNK